MTEIPDFEFTLGHGRRLKGHGWRGLIALAMLLTTILVAISQTSPRLETMLRQVISR